MFWIVHQSDAYPMIRGILFFFKCLICSWFGHPIEKMIEPMALILAKLLASTNALGGNRISSNPFSDVPSNHWAYNSLISLASKGVINAYGNAKFNGDRYATRYEAAMMVAKAAVAD